MKKYTEEQLQWYLAYEKVRKKGSYNMYDPRARHATGLTPEQYAFVMDNFTALRNAVDQKEILQ